MQQVQTSFKDIKHVSFSKIIDVKSCINWIEQSLFGLAGARWAKTHVQTHKITSTEQLLTNISLLWPTSVFINKNLPFDITKKYISIDFIKSVPEDYVIECAFHLGLGRPPDASGLSHYKKQIQATKNYSKLINDILFSEEALNHEKRKVITQDQIKSIQNDAMMRSASVFFRRPKSNFQNFFEKRVTSIAVNETKSEWYFVYKDLSSNVTVLSAGVNLIGETDHNGYLRCGTDWIMYGPKIHLPAGKYTICVEIDAPSEFKYHFDASYGGGIQRIFEMSLSGNLNIKYTFDIPENIDEFEIRLLNLTARSETINIKKISVKHD